MKTFRIVLKIVVDDDQTAEDVESYIDENLHDDSNWFNPASDEIVAVEEVVG